MENFPWWAIALIGVCAGFFVGVIVGFSIMQKLNDAEKTANKK